MTDRARIPPAQQPERTSVRWALAIGSVALGVLFLVAAKLVAYNETWLRGDHASFWSGLFVNVGTTLLLAAVLIWFERVIVKKVREDRQVAVTQAATQAAEAASQKTADAILPRLNDLDERLRERAKSNADARAAAADLVGSIGSRDAVLDAMREAEKTNALTRGPWDSASDLTAPFGAKVRVPAGRDLAAPVVEVSFDPLNEWTSGEELRVAHAIGARTVTASVVWEEGMTPDDVFEALHDAMVAGGNAPAAKLMSAEALFSNLSSLLRDAIRARHADDEAWLTVSPVIEMVADGCVINEEGIEVRGFGVVAKRSQFGHYSPSIVTKVVDESLPAIAPYGIDVNLWDAAITRARGHFLRSPLDR